MACILKPIENSKLPEISLPDGEEVIIGRGPSSKIKDARCSRTQIKFLANYKSRQVTVEQLGPNESALNGNPVGIGMKEVGKDHDTVDILFGEYRYRIGFEGLPPLEVTKPAKIPKMFHNSSSSQFKKDTALPKGGVWSSKADALHMYCFGDVMRRAKANVAGFDMDGTIITTKSGKVFPKDDKDWKFLYNTTVEKLRTFFEENDNFKFVIVTNQAGVGTGKTSFDGIKKKVEAIVSQLAIPTIVFIIPGKTEYRKPMTGIWKVLVEEFNESVEPNQNESFYCGDAAGRKKDHSLGDRLFALNLGIGFKTPEEFFMGQKRPQEFTMPLFQPNKLIESPPSNDHIKYPSTQEMVIMVGYPGSGKSSFAKTSMESKSYIYVNRDTLKTAAKCMSATEEALRNGKSVVVDNTNPERKDRIVYINLAKKFKVPVRCFRMNVSHQQALHNNRFRELCRGGGGVSVPAVAFYTFKSRLQEPTKDEGFTEVVIVNFVPNFEDSKKMDLYTKYLLEK